jgi:hypothetical protein
MKNKVVIEKVEKVGHWMKLGMLNTWRFSKMSKCTSSM